MAILGIAVFGAIGSVLRYFVHIYSQELFGSSFPYGTLVVNVVGSLLIGFLYILFIEKFQISSEIRLAILVGLLGGFTTFSTFSLETLQLINSGDVIAAMSNIALSIGLCLLACFLGITIARII